MSQQEVKIRVLPRKNEKSQAPQPASSPPEASSGKVHRWIIYVGTASVLALIAAFAIQSVKAPRPETVEHTAPVSPPGPSGKADFNSVQDPISAKVTRHLQDAKVKEEMMRRQLELDNMRLEQTADNSVALLEDESDRPDYGIQMDSEDTAEKVYRDLTYRRPTQNTDYLPDDRISARLANRKWINEHERAERINFVRNFILSAYDRGYQVEIDQNLVVVGVKKITEPKKVNIDQIIDRMAKQGF